MYRSGGTKASPSATLINYGMGRFAWRGHTGSVFNTQDAAFIDVTAGSTFTASNAETYMSFATCPSGSLVGLERMRIQSNGYVGIGKTPEYANRLDVNGDMAIGSSASDATVSLYFRNSYGTGGTQDFPAILRTQSLADGFRLGIWLDKGGVGMTEFFKFYRTGNMELTEGNLTVVGNITARKIILDSMAHGGVTMTDAYPDTLTYTSAGQILTVGGRQGASGKAWTSGLLKNVTVTDSTMVAGVDGDYDISWDCRLNSVTGVAVNAQFNGYIYINDVKSEELGDICYLHGSAELEKLSATMRTIALKKNDVIKLKLINVDDANGNTIRVMYGRMHVGWRE
jgi:hypothetical protein